MPCSNRSAACMRRSSIAAKSRRGRTRCGLERSLLRFTGTDVIHQSGTSPHITGSLRQPRITQASLRRKEEELVDKEHGLAWVGAGAEGVQGAGGGAPACFEAHFGMQTAGGDFVHQQGEVLAERRRLT